MSSSLSELTPPPPPPPAATGGSASVGGRGRKGRLPPPPPPLATAAAASIRAGAIAGGDECCWRRVERRDNAPRPFAPPTSPTRAPAALPAPLLLLLLPLPWSLYLSADEGATDTEGAADPAAPASAVDGMPARGPNARTPPSPSPPVEAPAACSATGPDAVVDAPLLPPPKLALLSLLLPPPPPPPPLPCCSSDTTEVESPGAQPSPGGTSTAAPPAVGDSMWDGNRVPTRNGSVYRGAGSGSHHDDATTAAVAAGPPDDRRVVLAAWDGNRRRPPPPSRDPVSPALSVSNDCTASDASPPGWSRSGGQREWHPDVGGGGRAHTLKYGSVERCVVEPPSPTPEAHNHKLAPPPSLVALHTEPTHPWPHTPRNQTSTSAMRTSVHGVECQGRSVPSPPQHGHTAAPCTGAASKPPPLPAVRTAEYGADCRSRQKRRGTGEGVTGAGAHRTRTQTVTALPAERPPSFAPGHAPPTETTPSTAARSPKTAMQSCV